MAKQVTELPLYKFVEEFCDAVSALLRKPEWRRNFKLRGQIEDATDSIAANLDEGFEQGTDRAFARYVTISKSSLGETLGHLRRAYRKQLITLEELTRLLEMGNALGRMLGGFIKYLHLSDFRGRGRHRDRGSLISDP
jgi:four helix bundle protein